MPSQGFVHGGGSYQAAPAAILRQTAVAYGSTLTAAMTAGRLTGVSGEPHATQIFYFAAGGLVAFALLAPLLGSPAGGDGAARQVLPYAGMLNFLRSLRASGRRPEAPFVLHSLLV